MDADGRPAYASSFSHDQEQASPGYYAVTLKDSNVRAELTTTTRVGVHRYAYPTDRAARVVLDLTHRDQVLDSSLTIANDHELSTVQTTGGCGQLPWPRAVSIARVHATW